MINLSDEITILINNFYLTVSIFIPDAETQAMLNKSIKKASAHLLIHRLPIEKRYKHRIRMLSPYQISTKY